MKEQKRAAKSRSNGQKSIGQKKWPTVVSNSKANKATETSGKKKSAIDKKKQQLINQLSELTLPDIILPKFSLTTENISSKNILSISKADIGYLPDKPLLKNINLSLGGKERIAIYGKNGSGKSTLLKAILEYDEVITIGNWSLPKRKYIGYIDQHYSNLNPEISIFDYVRNTRSDWNENETRDYLNDFLFRKNEEVFKSVQYLSGGEKARLSLCLISAKLPKILVLDEITNNIDIETKKHLIQILKHYPGRMIIVSHEEYFLNSIGIDQKYTVKNGELLK